MTVPLVQGRIVWVEMVDPQGRNPKTRPAVIVTPTSEIGPDGEVVVVAVTSVRGEAKPELCVPLPWHRDGHPKTQLKRSNEVVCNWAATVPVASITSVLGVVPFAQMSRILTIIRDDQSRIHLKNTESTAGEDPSGNDPPP